MPQKPPPIVYKYRNWQESLHQRILSEQELFLAPISSLNDPIDSRICIDHSALDNPLKQRQYVTRVVLENLMYGIGSGSTIAQNIEIGIKKLSDESSRSLHQEQFEKRFRDWLDQCYGVISLSKTWQSHTLWALYAQGHSGFVVGYHTGLLEDLTRKGLPVFTGAGLVEYLPSSELSCIDPLSRDIPSEISRKKNQKLIDWHLEEEFRLSANFCTLHGDGFVPTIADRQIKVPKNIIAEVVLGMRCSHADSEQILELAKQLQLPVYKARIQGSKISRELVYSPTPPPTNP